jgi:hypothetical protein
MLPKAVSAERKKGLALNLEREGSEKNEFSDSFFEDTF